MLVYTTDESIKDKLLDNKQVLKKQKEVNGEMKTKTKSKTYSRALTVFSPKGSLGTEDSAWTLGIFISTCKFSISSVLLRYFSNI